MREDPGVRIAVVGGGLAGLVAAATARAAGATVTLYERAPQVGGISIHSGGWIWRYRDLATFREHAPLGDPAVQAAIIEQFNDALAWLAGGSERMITAQTGRAITVGARVDMPATCAWLGEQLRASIRYHSEVVGAQSGAAGIELLIAERSAGESQSTIFKVEQFDRVIFAGGGHAADLDRIARATGVSHVVRQTWTMRAAGGGDGASQNAAAALGARWSPTTGECFVRLVALSTDDRRVAVDPSRFGELIELPAAVLIDADGRSLPRDSLDWVGSNCAWELARSTGSGWLILPSSALGGELHGARVDQVVHAAARAGARVEPIEDERVRIAVGAGFTHSIDGLVVDALGRCLADGAPLPGCYAVGCDAVGAGAGGYASGLAQALVLGRSAGLQAAN